MSYPNFMKLIVQRLSLYLNKSKALMTNKLPNSMIALPTHYYSKPHKKFISNPHLAPMWKTTWKRPQILQSLFRMRQINSNSCHVQLTHSCFNIKIIFREYPYSQSLKGTNLRKIWMWIIRIIHNWCLIKTIPLFQ
jgi:hypothetical protein